MPYSGASTAPRVSTKPAMPILLISASHSAPMKNEITAVMMPER